MRYNTETNFLLIILFLSLGLGIIYDCVRILFFTIFGTFDANLDKNGFAMKFFLICLASSIITRIIFKYSELSGHKTEKSLFFRRFYVIIMIIFSALNMFTIYPSIFYEELGFYILNVNFIIRLLNYSFYIPLFIFIIGRSGVILNEIKNKKTQKRVIFPVIFLGILTIERSFSIGYLSPIIESYSIIIIDYLFLSLILICLCLFVFKYPDTMEAISTYFSIKSVYLIRTNGNLIFEFDFDKPIPQYPYTSKRLILAGFIYAVSKGFKAILEFDRDIKTINFWDVSLQFEHGKYIFGVLFTTETSPKIAEKLKKFITKFEDSYDQELKDWKGELSFLDRKKVKNCLLEYFR
ncbi:MAG: hypothetical protein ACFFCM_01320 [Promethearchaeota archaeon]